MDADGHLVGKSGAGNIDFFLTEGWPYWITRYNPPCIPRSGQVRIRYTTPDAGHIPTFVRLRDIDSTVTFGAASAPFADPQGTGWTVVTQTYTPLPQMDNYYAPQLSIITDGVADFQCITIDEMIDPAWPHDTHPVLYGRLKGFGFYLRHVNSLMVVGNRDSTWADRARDSRVSPDTASVTHTANLVSVGPISESDPIVISRFAHNMKSPIIRIEVDSTAGFSSGHVMNFAGLSQYTFADTATSGNPPDATGPGVIDLSQVNLFDVEDATHFVGRPSGTTSIPDPYSPFITAAGTTAVTGQCYQEVGIGESHESIIRLHNETDTHLWIHIPHAADDDYAAQMGMLYGDTLHHDLNVVVELSNEIWNTGGGGVFVAKSYAQELLAKYLHDWGLDNTLPHPTNLFEAVTQRAIELFTLFTDAFEAAGGDRSRVKWALMGQTHDIGSTVAAAIGYLISDRLGAASTGVPVFHYFGGDGYFNNMPDYPGGTNYGQAYATAVLDDLDVSGNISLTAKHQLHDRMKALTDSMLDNMALLPYSAEIAIYEYSYNHLRYGASVETVPQSSAAICHPRMFKLRTARHQQFQRYGIALACQFVMDEADSNPPNYWTSFDNIETAVGTGDPSENPNPLAADRVTQTGGADRAWMLGVANSPPSPPSPEPMIGLDGYLGRYQAGQDVPLSVYAPGASGGTFRVYGGGVLVGLGVLAGPTDPELSDRLSGHLMVGRGFVPGTYFVVYSYDGTDPAHASRLATFEVAGGGDGAGSVIAGLVLRAAEGDAVLLQLRSAILASARGPYLDEGIG